MTIGIALCILNLGSRWRWLVSFTLRPLYPRGKNSGTHWIGGWVCPRAGLDDVAKRKILSCRESKPGIPSRSLDATYMDWPVPALNFFVNSILNSCRIKQNNSFQKMQMWDVYAYSNRNAFFAVCALMAMMFVCCKYRRIYLIADINVLLQS
jgi:hypothetical protein